MHDLIQIGDTPPLQPAFSLSSIDIFITYRCGLRCSHCFVGDNLDTSYDMPLKTVAAVLVAARDWSVSDVTFLGGEPTMHPDFLEALDLAHAAGLKTRIVTNGHTSYGRFLDQAAGTRPFVCFSVDGSQADVHDKIRGRGSFGILRENIRRTQDRGYRTGGIVALCRDNAHDVEGILRFCDDFQFEYANIHYVTSRGFAKPEAVLSVAEWQALYARIQSIAPHLKTELRVEKTFCDATPGTLRCAVNERSNLMFLPDGRVYMCMMFIDVPQSHSFVWDARGTLVGNGSATSEQSLAIPGELGCPAMAFVNRQIAVEAEQNRQFIQCIYQKERLRPGNSLA